MHNFIQHKWRSLAYTQHTHRNIIATRWWPITASRHSQYAINSAPTTFTPQHSQKAPIFPLTTGEWTILRTHACYRLKEGTKRSARQCTIRWYHRRPSNSTMATNTTIRLCPEAIGQKFNILVSYLFCIPWYPTLTRGENRLAIGQNSNLRFVPFWHTFRIWRVKMQRPANKLSSAFLFSRKFPFFHI